MKNHILIFLFLFVAVFSPAAAQVIDQALLAKGMNFIETKTYPAEDDAKILELYKNLRVTDVSIGGVLVCPGDVVVGDGDGVVVVPRAIAEQVARYANEVLKKDKAGRKGLYESLGRPLDKTVKQE